MPLIKYIPLIGSFGEKFGGAVETSSTKPVTNTAGLFGSGYSFGPTTTYVKANDLRLTPEMSFSVWVKFTSLVSGFILDCRSSEAGYQPLYFNTSSGIQFFSSGSKSGGYVNIGSVSTGKWYHLVATLKNDVASIYLDGVLKGTVSASGLNIDSYVTIGNRHSFATGAPGCIIQDVKIYNHALSQKEIYDLSLALLAYYKFDSTTNLSNYTDELVGIDYSGHGLHLTNHGVGTALYSGQACSRWAIFSASGTNWLSYSGIPARNDQLTVALWFNTWADATADAKDKYHIAFAIDSGVVEISIPGNALSDKGKLRFGGHTSNNGRVCNNVTAKTATGESTTLNNGTEHYITIVYDGNAWVGYTNGVQVGSFSATGTIPYTNKVLTIGRYYNDSTSAYGAACASMDEIKIFNKALTPTQVKNLYHESNNGVSIDRKGSLFINQFALDSSASTVQFQEKLCKETKINFLSETIHLPDGSVWLQVTHHNNSGGINLFSASDNFDNSFVYHNRDCWANFPLIKAFGNYNNRYEFMAWEQSRNTDNFIIRRWSQTISPYDATWDNTKPGQTTVTHIENMPSDKGGLYRYKNSNSSSSSAFMVISNSSKSNWFGAFGSTSSWSSGGIAGIPGFSDVVAGDFDLFVRIDPSNEKYREYKQGIVMPNSINII